ncbi:MAG TPA: hypothetical protein VLV29_01195, partial [Steroidobacteraceae bacterium]|nr:hypothetical protein [Steroidobacteraceae bacterium]
EIFAAVANSGAPTGDEHLRLERVSAAPGMVLLYQYTLLDPTDDLAALRQQLPPRTAPAKVLCDDPDMLRAGVRVRWHFSDRRGRDVGTVEAGPQDCGADKAQDAPD